MNGTAKLSELKTVGIELAVSLPELLTTTLRLPFWFRVERRSRRFALTQAVKRIRKKALSNPQSPRPYRRDQIRLGGDPLLDLSPHPIEQLEAITRATVRNERIDDIANRFDIGKRAGLDLNPVDEQAFQPRFAVDRAASCGVLPAVEGTLAQLLLD